MSELAPWPEPVREVFERFLTADVATVTQKGTPVTLPLTPYVGTETLDVSTGVTYPAKAERVRRRPKVAMLFHDSYGSGLAEPPTVLVQGVGAVRDADLQTNTDRYVKESLAKLPGAWRGQPRLLVRAQPWYWARIYVEITPILILWWPKGDMSGSPQSWRARTGTALPRSDPAPDGRRPPPWQSEPAGWRERAEHSLANLGPPTLTVIGPEGYPLIGKTEEAALRGEGFRLALPGWIGEKAVRPAACLTFGAVHGEDFRGQENACFIGELRPEGAFVVERLLPDFSLPSRGLDRYRSFFGARSRLRHRLRTECARRDQAVPKVHLPATFPGRAR